MLEYHFHRSGLVGGGFNSDEIVIEAQLFTMLWSGRLFLLFSFLFFFT